MDLAEYMAGSEFFQSLERCIRIGINIKAIRVNRENVLQGIPKGYRMTFYGIPIEFI